MPQIRSKQIKGDVPVNPTDLVTKSYVDNLIGSGGTLTIKDENSEVLTGVTIINFIGADVAASVGGVHQVNIYIPPTSYAPYFNSGTAIVSSATTYNRYISAPASEGFPFKIGDWVAGTSHRTINGKVVNSLSYTTPQSFNIYNLSTTFDAIVYDADGTSILSQHTIILSGNTTVTSSNITITVGSWSNDSDRYKATISVTINIGNILLSGGRFSIKLIHHNNGTDYIFTDNNIFKDNDNLTANISGSLTVVTGTTIVTKQISGVYFYKEGTQWQVHLYGINDLNSRSYPTTKQLLVTETNLFCSSNLTANGNNGDFGSWTNAHNNDGATYDNSTWVTDELDYTNWGGTGLLNTYATASLYDWSDSTPVVSVNSPNYPYLIDTFVDTLSDRNSEMFRTENNSLYPRLMSDCTTSWDSGQTLITYDGGTGLQIIGDRLVYPQYDFTSYYPNVTSQPNYIGLSGDKSYYRKFETNGLISYNVIILLGGHNITESDISSGNVKFEISADKTKWLDVRYEFFIPDGSTSCRIESDVYNLTLNDSIKVTFENFTPEYPDNFTSFIYLKITYSNTAKDKYIGNIDMMGDYWS